MNLTVSLLAYHFELARSLKETNVPFEFFDLVSYRWGVVFILVSSIVLIISRFVPDAGTRKMITLDGFENKVGELFTKLSSLKLRFPILIIAFYSFQYKYTNF